MARQFMGFEKNEKDQLVAVVNFPDARKIMPYRDESGQIKTVATPNPHEERLDEEGFKLKTGLQFSDVQNLPFQEQGHDIDKIIAEKRMATEPANEPSFKISANQPNR